MNCKKSSFTEIDELQLQVCSLKRALDNAETKHRLAILSAESFLDYLKCLYEYDD